MKPLLDVRRTNFRRTAPAHGRCAGADFASEAGGGGRTGFGARRSVGAQLLLLLLLLQSEFCLTYLFIRTVCRSWRRSQLG
jgi:hypothetical protein